jgi:hypothetical protein
MKEKPEEQVLLEGTEQASREAFKIFEKIVASWENRERPMAMFDHVLIAKLASQFIGFGFHAMKSSMGFEGANRWLQMALGFVEDDLGDMAGKSLKLPIVWDGKTSPPEKS